MALPEIRPLTFGETLDRSFAFYRSHFLTLALICLIPGALVAPLNLFLRVPGGRQTILANPTQPPDFGPMFRFIGVIYAFLALYSFLHFLAMAASVFAVSELYLGRPVSVADAYRRMFQRFWALANVWISVVIRVIGCCLTFFLIPLAPLLFLWYAFSIPVVLVEKIKVRHALKRSRLLTKGQRGQIFLTFLLMTILAYIVAFALQSPFLLLEAKLVHHGELAPVWLTLLAGIFGAAGSAMTTPPLMVALTLMYFNTRVIREGYDLQLMMERLGSGTAAGVETAVATDSLAPTRLFGDLTPTPPPPPPEPDPEPPTV